MRTCLLVVMLGLVGSGCSSSAPPCSSATCAEGCCTSSGSCSSGRARSECGTGGELCGSCTSRQSCGAGACVDLPNGGGGGGQGGGSGDGGGASSAGARCDDLTGPVVFAGSQQRPEFVAADDTALFWTDSAAGTVMRAPFSGGGATVFAMNEADARGLSLDGENVVWTRYPGSQTRRKTKSSAAVTTLHSDISLAVHARQGYAFISGGNDRKVTRVPLGGGAPVLVAYEPDVSSAIASSSSSIFWVTDTNGRVMKGNPSGGDAGVLLASGFGRATAIAVREPYVYWGTTSGIVGRVGTNGSGAVALIRDAGFIGDLAVTAGELYVSDYGFDRVSVQPLDGGALRAIATGQSSPGGLAVSGDCVFWTNRDDGTVMRAPR